LPIRQPGVHSPATEPRKSWPRPATCHRHHILLDQRKRSTRSLPVHRIHTKNICDEDPVELGLLQQLGQLYPVGNLIEAPGFIVRMLPKARRLVATACMAESGEELKGTGDRSRNLHISTKALSTRLFFGLVSAIAYRLSEESISRCQWMYVWPDQNGSL
jgi:hypothetical protein